MSEILPGIWQFKDGDVYCFLVVGTEKALLIDTGFGNLDLAGAVKSVTSLPVTLVNTHADGDHLLGNAAFQPALLHPADFARAAGAKEVPFSYSPLWEGTMLDIGARTLEVILLSGHTPGSIALLDADNKLLFIGDTVMRNAPVFLFGEGRNLPSYIAGLEKLLAMSERFDLLLPSHGDCPLPRSAVADTLAAARLLMRGELPDAPPPFEKMPCRLYKSGETLFCY